MRTFTLSARLGHKCFQIFLESSEYFAKNPCGKLALTFIITVKGLVSQLPPAALETIEAIKKDYINSQVRHEVPAHDRKYMYSC